MLNINFYLHNVNIPDVDFTSPQHGNPGCGGTEYLFVALPYYLSKIRGKTCHVVIHANITDNLPKSLECHVAKDVIEAAEQAENMGADFFIYRPTREPELDFLRFVDSIELRTIAWFHITPTHPHLRLLAKSSATSAAVCVEHEQYDLAQDSSIWNKLTFIVNGFDLDGFQLKTPPQKDPNLVVYLGALVPQKGFHILAKAWKKVLLRHPKAHLAVLGSGKLYDSSAKLGPWKIAEEQYEKECIIPYLSGADAQPLPSVTFYGTLGIEKKQLLYQASIGVPNPSGHTENCPGSALEFQACGTPIVSGAFLGLLDTVLHNKTGFLGKTEQDLIDNICLLLNSNSKVTQFGDAGIRFVENKYNFDTVTKEWVDLFERLQQNKNPIKFKFKRNLHQHSKWLILFNRFFQITIGRIIKWPSVIEIKIYLAKLKLKIKLNRKIKKENN